MMNLVRRTMLSRFVLTIAAAALTALIFGGQTACVSNCDLKIKTASLPNGVVGVDYRFNLNSNCGGDYWFVNDGTLPPGIQLQSDGDLRGTPTAIGTFNLTIAVSDFRTGDTAFQGFQIVVLPAAAATPTATVGP